MYKKGISCVVVNYKTTDLLEKFLQSYFYQESKVETELIVIDIGLNEISYDKSREMLSQFKGLGEYQYWPCFTEMGYAGACNFASTVSNREMSAYFNADTQLYDDTLDLCYSYLQDNPDTAICGPLQVSSEGRVTHAGIVGTNERPRHRGWNAINVQDYTYNLDNVISVSGSAYFIKRKIWDEITEELKKFEKTEGAMLNTDLYYEETFVSYMARHLGYRIGYVGEAIMIHEWNKSPHPNKQKLMKKSRARFREACDYFGIEHD